MHKHSIASHIIVLLGALASCADPGAPDGDSASTEATTESTTTTTGDAPTGTSLPMSTGTTTEEPGVTTEGSGTTSDESGTTSEGDPQIFKNCAEGNALQGAMQAWSCGCSVAAGDYPTLRECLAATGTTPEEDACTCEVFAAEPQNAAFVACQTEAFAVFVACVMPLDCADDGGIEACYAQLGAASTTCEQPAPDVFREISMKCED